MLASKNIYTIQPGPLHQGGTLTIEKQTETKLHLQYQITKKAFIPIPDRYLSGNYQFDIPPQFSTEEGYLELEKNKTLNWGRFNIFHGGRSDFYQWKDSHLIELQLKKGKGQARILYHPDIPGCGWGEIKITIHQGLPFLENYTLSGEIKI